MNESNIDANTIKYDNKDDFSKGAKKLLINQLYEKGIIKSEDEKTKILNYYNNDKREIEVVFEEIKNLKREDIEAILKKMISKDQNKKENKISLENIKDFTKEQTGKTYISIHGYYPNDEIRVIENTTNKSAKQLFEEFKDEDGLITVDGFVNNMDVYKESVSKDKKEIEIRNITELCSKKNGEFNKLSKAEQEVVKGTVISIINQLSGISKQRKEELKKTPIEDLINMFDKDIYLSPKENIVMICKPNSPAEDMIMTVSIKDGEYFLKSLDVKSEEYTANNKNAQAIESESAINEEKEEEKQEIGGASKVMKKPKLKRPINSNVYED